MFKYIGYILFVFLLMSQMAQLEEVESREEQIYKLLFSFLKEEIKKQIVIHKDNDDEQVIYRAVYPNNENHSKKMNLIFKLAYVIVKLEQIEQEQKREQMDKKREKKGEKKEEIEWEKHIIENYFM